jgi:hypothetical protein
MATLINTYPTNVYHQQPYYYPTLPSFYPSQPVPNNYNIPPPQQQQQTTRVQYVDSGMQSLRPRRAPRFRREVIVLPTPEPIYRQVRHRLPTPERQVIQRTFIQKANGDLVVQQQQQKQTKSSRSQSRSETSTKTRSSRSRQVNTD